MAYQLFIFTIILSTNILPLSALEVGIGPFGLKINAGIHIGEHDDYVESIDDPLCAAITNKHLVEIIIEPSNYGELKRLIIEPYLMGYNINGELILKGYKIEHVTYSEDVIEDDNYLGRGGVITELEDTNGSWRSIRLNRVIRINILRNTHFKVRKIDFDDDNEITHVICEANH